MCNICYLQQWELQAYQSVSQGHAKLKPQPCHLSLSHPLNRKQKLHWGNFISVRPYRFLLHLQSTAVRLKHHRFRLNSNISIRGIADLMISPKMMLMLAVRNTMMSFSLSQPQLGIPAPQCAAISVRGESLCWCRVLERWEGVRTLRWQCTRAGLCPRLWKWWLHVEGT